LAQELFGTSDIANAPLPKPEQPLQLATVEPRNSGGSGGDSRQVEELSRRIDTLETQFGDHDRKLQQTVNIMSKLIERL
jgi:hypothetical protein